MADCAQSAARAWFRDSETDSESHQSEPFSPLKFLDLGNPDMVLDRGSLDDVTVR